MQIPQINIDEFNYFLPEERIAQIPLANRDESKLLCFDRNLGTISHCQFKDIAELLPANSFLIRNITKVFPARLYLYKPTGGKVELLLEDSISEKLSQIALTKNSPQIWECTVKGKNLNIGLTLYSEYNIALDDKQITTLKLTGEIIGNEGGKRNIKLSWEPSDLTFAEFLTKIAEIPLPPYIKRKPSAIDEEHYQTEYAKISGSIAAPTAGLHFTTSVDNAILNKGIDIAEIVLHVGSGTFQPIKSKNVSEHNMHCEKFQISLDFLQKLEIALQNEKKIIAVGTTTVRTLETLFWIAQNLALNENMDNFNFHLSQWNWIQLQENIILDAEKSINKLIQYCQINSISQIIGSTELFILPSYKFRIVQGIITNFHLPKSTLLLLVGAFIGRENLQKIYNEALLNNYRFLSYGDTSLLI
jgi:S-adenosylmethionine:tRNA ribosyltransferase-isomerase